MPAIILYGSFADETNNAGSDFNALLITDKAEFRYDNLKVWAEMLAEFVDDCCKSFGY